jgi:GH15 family glucan-1,4-alpha-glucosidase
MTVELPRPFNLRQYALIADGERGAIIGPDGAIVWLCIPHWHSPAVFSALLGGMGHYAISPDAPFVWGGHYEPGTLIWRSRWVTPDAIIECREALARPARRDRLVLLRRVELVDGAPAAMHARLPPRAGYDDAPLARPRREAGVWTAETGCVHVRWLGAPRGRATTDGHRGHLLEQHLVVHPGRPHDFVLELATAPFTHEPPDPQRSWTETQDAWHELVPPADDLVAARDARHAYAVLAGLTGSTGGMVAAATTSLPERADAGRSYDYRYVWIRDQCFAGQAVAAFGPHQLLDDTVRFVTARLLDDGAQLQPAYTVSEARIPDEQTIPLAGYPGGVDTIGNHVREQFQLDVFGEALLLFAAADRHDHLDVDGWRAAERAVDAIAGRWTQPDAGIWELGPDRWTHSRLACVAGLNAISAAPGTPEQAAARWRELSAAILVETTRTATHPSGRWQRAPDDRRVDAALLLAAVRGALPPDDPRSLATHDAVLAELSDDGYLYRFAPSEAPLGDEEGAFVLCGFWTALASLQRGDRIEAARWFERNRAACGPPGLYSEEYDVSQRQLRGNLPQAFVHAGMLESSARLSAALRP